jgi:hypothetical protein
MKVRTLLVVIAACLVAAAVASAGSNAQLVGKFETKISGKSAALNGTWRISFTQSGRFSTTRNGKLAVTGAAAAANGKIAMSDTAGPYACKGTQAPATYTYSLKGNKLTLKATFDQCAGRKAVFTTQPLTKIG